MKRKPRVVWPEGQPERAVLCLSWLSEVWARNGFSAMISMRRMTCVWSVDKDEDPVEVARAWETEIIEIRKNVDQAVKKG